MTRWIKRRPARPRSWWLWVGYWVFLFVVMHIPVAPAGSIPVPHADKMMHFVVYFILAFLGGRHLLAAGRRIGGLLCWAGAYLAYAGMDEWLQQFVGRRASAGDWVFDAIGIAAATVVVFLCRPRGGRLSEHTGGMR